MKQAYLDLKRGRFPTTCDSMNTALSYMFLRALSSETKIIPDTHNNEEAITYSKGQIKKNR